MLAGGVCAIDSVRLWIALAAVALVLFVERHLLGQARKPTAEELATRRRYVNVKSEIRKVGART